MITSHVMMPAFFKRDSLGLFVEDNSSLIEIARYNFDLGLEVGELIKISNLMFLERNYTFEARVRSKIKIIKEEEMTTPDDVMYTLKIEYVVDIEKKEDLLIIRQRLGHLPQS